MSQTPFAARCSIMLLHQVRVTVCHPINYGVAVDAAGVLDAAETAPHSIYRSVAIPPKATVCCAAAKCRYGPLAD